MGVSKTHLYPKSDLQRQPPCTVGSDEDQCVSLSVKGSWAIIDPCQEGSLTLADRLARFDPEKHGGEIMATDMARGAGKW